MNTNINNLKSSISTQETSIKSKKVNQETPKSDFQKSLDSSINSTKVINDKNSEINVNIGEINGKNNELNNEVYKINCIDQIDLKDIDKLKALIQLIDLVSKENLNVNNQLNYNNKSSNYSFENIVVENLNLKDVEDINLQNTQDINLENTKEINIENIKDINVKNDKNVNLEKVEDVNLKDHKDINLEEVKNIDLEVIENKDINSKKPSKDINIDFNLENPQNDVSLMFIFNQLFINDNFDNNKVNLDNVNKDELIQNIFKNNDTLNSLVKDIVSDFENSDMDFVNNINKIFENGKFLTSDQLLKNIKNEISQKINKSEVNDLELIKNNIDHFNNSDSEIKNLNSISEIKTSFDKSENILKEISGTVKEIDKNFENFLVNNMRSNNLNSEIGVFHKVIDTTVQTKFVKEFVESINYMNTNNKSEMIIKLNPEHLGKMDIKYEVVKDNVRLMIRVEKVEALKFIDNLVGDIKNMIKENHQINLDNIHVNLQEFGFSSNNQQGSNQKNNKQEDNKSVQAINLKLEDEENSYDKEKKNLRSGILV